MQGLLLITKNPLLTEIQARHPNGIYSVTEFKEKITPGIAFYLVIATAHHNVSSVEYPKTLDSIKPYDGDYEDFKGHFIYTLRGDSTSRFLNDLMSPACACFIDKLDAEKYQEDIHKNHEKLIALV
jgi:hypothetical protein